MRHLTETATDTAASQYSLVPWIPLLIAFVVAATTVGTALWNTRGESAALRQLKGMNEAIDGMPSSSDARGDLEAARDRLARRIAERDTKATRLRRTGPPIAAGATLVIAIALQLLVEVFNPGSASQVAWDRPILVGAITLGTLVGIGLISAVVNFFSRRDQ